MKDQLDSLTDSALAEAFAVEVAGWKNRFATHDDPIQRGGSRLPNHFGPSVMAWWHEDSARFPGVYVAPPPFATSVDAVLPWLEKAPHVEITHINGVWVISVHADVYVCSGQADAPTFARAACLALLRAARAKKGQQ